MRLGPDYADAHANLGAALTPTDAEEAVRELEKAVALAPASVKAQFNLAVAYGASPAADRRKEIEQLRKVIELAPTFARAHLALGKALLRDGKVPEAVAALQEAARLEPRAAKPTTSSAWPWRAPAARRKPRRSSRRAASSSPPTTATRTRTSTSPKAAPRSSRGDLERAAAKFRHALQLQPGRRAGSAEPAATDGATLRS